MAQHMHDAHCFSCQVIAGNVSQPGGILFENEYWTVRSRSHPVFIPGYLFIILKRHCENITQLTKEEADALGPTIKRTCEAIEHVISPERIYVASYGEGVKHIHFHITPRTASMPAGNGAVFLYHRWRELLYRLGMKSVAYSETDTLQTVSLLKAHLNGNRSDSNIPSVKGHEVHVDEAE